MLTGIYSPNYYYNLLQLEVLQPLCVVMQYYTYHKEVNCYCKEKEKGRRDFLFKDFFLCKEDEKGIISVKKVLSFDSA
jgi:hypothetical protein